MRPVFALIFALAFGLSAHAAAQSVPPMPQVSENFIERGRTVYVKRCSSCHGLLGDGQGPAATFMDPRPRDFTFGYYKIRSTGEKQLPTNEDLFRTVSDGLPGTAMQGFDDGKNANGLSTNARWQVIAYIKTFVEDFEDAKPTPVALPTNQPPVDAALIAQGAKVFEAAKCWECHGAQGRGNGTKAKGLKDDLGFPVRVRNLTLPWKNKGGARVADIYKRVTGGIAGTPMPSYLKLLNEDERWAVAAFAGSLARPIKDHQALVIGQTRHLPIGPNDPAWDAAPFIDIRLTGQAIVPPRWQNPAVELVTVRALSDGETVAFQLSWDDPFQDNAHDDTQELSVDLRQPYAASDGAFPRKPGVFRDAAALVFPAKVTQSGSRPHFLRGSSARPVRLWQWSSDGKKDGEATARGWRSDLAPITDAKLKTRAIWHDGQWRMMMTRPIMGTKGGDTLFAPGYFTPMAVNIWDGSNGEHGLIMATSSWYFVTLPITIPMAAYIKALLAVVLVGAAMWGMKIKVQRRRKHP